MNKQLLTNNYFVIKNFLSEEDAKSLAKTFRKESKIHSYIDPSGYIGKYNYFPSLKILCNKLHTVSEISGWDLLPTYALIRTYLPGEELTIHDDRLTCEVSLTVNLNGSGDWPIYIEDPKCKPSAVILNPGDAMLYLGTVAKHWREPNTTGDEYTQMFLHYVRSDGFCRDYYFNNNAQYSYESSLKSKLRTYYDELRRKVST